MNFCNGELKLTVTVNVWGK